MRFIERFFLLACLAAPLALPSRGEAQTRTIKCESGGDQRHLCSVPNLNESSVRVSKKLSQSACIQGRTWGTVNNNIWVSNGCRAEFSYVLGVGGGSNNAAGSVRTIRCESQGDARHACQVPRLNEASVKMVNRLSDSPCVKGTSWGSAADAIWVSRGCRAEFSFRTN